MTRSPVDTVVIIPARYDSKRLPGKPLVPIAGKSLIRRTWEIASAVQGVSQVFVATDDARILEHVEEFGGRALMTPRECRNGTERVLAAAELLPDPPRAIVNFQGDAVLTPPWVIRSLVHELEESTGTRIATPAVRLTDDVYYRMKDSKQRGEVGGTTVVFNRDRYALYFSKSLIPYLRSGTSGEPPVYRHIGLYGFTMDALKEYARLPAGILETAEQIEILRALEHGLPVRVVQVDYEGRTHWAVDSEADVRRVEEIIAKEGELLWS